MSNQSEEDDKYSQFLSDDKNTVDAPKTISARERKWNILKSKAS